MKDRFLARVRQHHAIEHATVAVLFERRGRMVTVGGLSDPWGFHLAGDFDAAEIESCAQEALTRLQAGEHWLAISNQCGTTLALTGAFTAAAVLAAARGQGFRRFQPAMTAGVFAAGAAQPAGRWMQRVMTTDSNVDGLVVGRARNLAGRDRNRLVRVTVRTAPQGHS
ncbi:MAG: DUF6391 domain-containing protein [Dehalococcoidia bacterium]